jgi:hypothetical protein
MKRANYSEGMAKEQIDGTPAARLCVNSLARRLHSFLWYLKLSRV